MDYARQYPQRHNPTTPRPQIRKEGDQIRKVIGFANEVYQKNEASPFKAIGVKTLYYNGLVYLRAASILRDKQLLDVAQKKLETGYAIAPTRFEFIYSLLDIALAKGDKEMAKLLIAKAKLLRPDLITRTSAYEKELGLQSSSTASSTKP